MRFARIPAHVFSAPVPAQLFSAASAYTAKAAQKAGRREARRRHRQLYSNRAYDVHFLSVETFYWRGPD
jgi:hypothetical protein